MPRNPSGPAGLACLPRLLGTWIGRHAQVSRLSSEHDVTLHGLRQTLRALGDPGDVILYESESYFLSPDVPLWIDVEEFKRAWAEGQRREREHDSLAALTAYTRAARLYSGDLIEDDPYESWLDLEREHLKEVFLVILDKMSGHYSLDGDPEGAIRLCERMLEKDRCQEAVHRRLMLCYARLGLRDRALSLDRGNSLNATTLQARTLQACPGTNVPTTRRSSSCRPRRGAGPPASPFSPGR